MAVLGVAVPELRSTSSLAMPRVEEDRTTVEIVEIDEGRRVGVVRRTGSLLDSCRAKKRKASASVSEAVGFAVELMAVAMVTSSPGAHKSVDPRTDELMGQ